MAQENLTKQTNQKNVVEFRKELTRDGVTINNIYVDGRKVGIFGYTDEADRAAYLATWQKAIDSSASIYEAMEKMAIVANFTEKEISPDEEVILGNGTSFFISYGDRCAYDSDGEIIGNLLEMEGVELPDLAIKAMLTQKVQIAILSDGI